MKLEDKAALPWMARFSRDPIPQRIVWKQTGTLRDRSYWLAVDMKDAKGGSLVIANRQGQQIEIIKAEQITTLILRLDDRMLDLDQPVVVTHQGKELFRGVAARTIGTMISTLAGRGDPGLVFDSQVSVAISKVGE